MPSQHVRHEVPHAPEEMFALVADIESYPRFLPLVQALRIKRRDEAAGTMTAEMVVAYKMFRERFVSDVTLDAAGRRIEAVGVRGPLKSLLNEWRFEDAPGGGCVVDFRVDFSFRSRIMQAAAQQLLDRGFERLVRAFEEEAARRYG